eukprot:SAG11_NODE_16288_length_552_cov_0.801325_1_plen_51_part_01
MSRNLAAARAATCEQRAKDGCLTVVPAFETDPAAKLPRTQKQIRTMVERGD